MLWYENIPERGLLPPEGAYPVCPCCRNEAEEFYKDTNGAILGCDGCFPEDGEYDRAVDAWEEIA